MPKLILIDGNAIFHRAFHGLPLFQTSKGEYTNAVYGFIRMYLELVKREKPDYVAVAFDRAKKTFRHEEYSDYKAHRAAPPEQLYPQLPRLKEGLMLLQVPIYELDGYEADDILGTIAEKIGKDQGMQTIIVTGDRDAFQLATPNVHVMVPIKGISEVEEYSPERIFEKTGLKPDQIVDYKALKGDPSDNIKGISGIGEKQAVALLQKYGHLENIYQHLDELTLAQQKKLEEGREDAKLSKRLATILLDVPIPLNLEECRLKKASFEKLKAFFEELEFKSLVKNLKNYTDIVEEEGVAQQSLF